MKFKKIAVAFCMALVVIVVISFFVLSKILTPVEYSLVTPLSQMFDVQSAVFYGKIVYKNDSSLLLASMSSLNPSLKQAELILSPNDTTQPLSNISQTKDNSFLQMSTQAIKIFDENGNLVDENYLREGMLVYIPCESVNTSVVPSELISPSYIKIDKQASNLSALYYDVIKELYLKKPELYPNISIFGFDLRDTLNMNEAEKNALVYRIKNEYKVITVIGSYDQLAQSGFIGKEKGIFTNGILFTIDTQDQTSPDAVCENEFSFSASKWKSDFCALGYSDCIAKFDVDLGRWYFYAKQMWIL